MAGQYFSRRQHKSIPDRRKREYAEGRPSSKTIGCLKRHLARRIWRLLYTTQTPAAPPVQINHSNPQIPTFT